MIAPPGPPVNRFPSASNGPFASVDQLEEVPGIGPAKLEGMRAEVTV